MKFDFTEYKKAYNNKAAYARYEAMTNSLDKMIKDADFQDIATLCGYRSPVAHARMEYHNAVRAGMSDGKAFYTAVAAYEERREDFILRSGVDEVLHQADKKRCRGERLSKEEMNAELAAFLSKREV